MKIVIKKHGRGSNKFYEVFAPDYPHLGVECTGDYVSALGIKTDFRIKIKFYERLKAI